MTFFFRYFVDLPDPHSFPTRRSSDLNCPGRDHTGWSEARIDYCRCAPHDDGFGRSEEHTSELQSRGHLVCRLLLEKKKHMGKMAVRNGAASVSRWTAVIHTRISESPC